MHLLHDVFKAHCYIGFEVNLADKIRYCPVGKVKYLILAVIAEFDPLFTSSYTTKNSKRNVIVLKLAGLVPGATGSQV